MIDAYLQIDGIKGESTDDKHKDRIEVSQASTTQAFQAEDTTELTGL